jgi:hypothetical protein
MSSSQQNDIKERLAQWHKVEPSRIGFSTDKEAAAEGGRRLIHQEYIDHLQQEMYFFLIPAKE